MQSTIAAEDIQRHELVDGGVSVAVLSLGCITQDWRVPIAGARRSVVLGYDDPADYLANPNFFGAIVGRVANRIGGAAFTLDGERVSLDANEGKNQLHGGPVGLAQQNWHMIPLGPRSVQLTLHSPHGDMGFPGNVDFTVTLSLDGFRLRYEMSASSDRKTPINLANHNYYNLSGAADIRDHKVQINANGITPVDADKIPTGEVRDVTGTRFDLRRPVRFGDVQKHGYDHNFCLNGSPAATVEAGGLRLTLDTNQPGLQVYTADHLGAPGARPLDQAFAPNAGLCLEAQGYPDAVNQPGFPSVWISPEKAYHQVTDITIAPVA